jgi:hypothetical protein
MTDSSKFLLLRELSDSLSSKIETLQSGNLSRYELEKITDESRELYERLIVLRFKAFASEVKGQENNDQENHPQPKENLEPQVFNFRLHDEKPDVPVQVSLIDAIEEVIKNEAIEQVAAPIQAEENTAEMEPANEILSAVMPTSLHEHMSANLQKESLHEKLSKELNRPESLAQKLEHDPIADLKRAISLNQRFQFSKELFKGNNQDYELAIDKLNSSSRDEAMKHLESLRSKYSWNTGSTVAHDFVDLVERRHL